jgi:hypothetical protein
MIGTIFILFNMDIYSEIWQKGGRIKIMFENNHIYYETQNKNCSKDIHLFSLVIMKSRLLINQKTF